MSTNPCEVGLICPFKKDDMCIYPAIIYIKDDDLQYDKIKNKFCPLVESGSDLNRMLCAHSWEPDYMMSVSQRVIMDAVYKESKHDQ